MTDICVYCGSSLGRQPDYVKATGELASALVDRDLGLVYGGASVGMMGKLADAVLEQGGRVTGVIPEPLVDREVAHPSLTELCVVGSMHERKALMAERSDGFIALPGGLGTLEELFEMLTWAQLGMHRKPLGMLNIRGYYDGLVAFLDHAVTEAFVTPRHRSMLLIDKNAESLLQRFDAYVAPSTPKWIDQETS